ncbi:MAG: SBBP repeat-containing protein [Actinomycetota bacterium]
MAASALAGEDLGRIPLGFEENRGQADPSVRFLARSGNATVFLTDRSAGFHLVSDDVGATIELRPVGAALPVLGGEQRLPGRVNYLTGSDPEGWHTNVPTWGAVRYAGLWPGTDLLFYGTADGLLEYDLELDPGADPSRVAFEMAGAEDVRVGPQGDLVIQTAAGAITQRAPVIYQETVAGRQPVEGGFRLRGSRLGFRIGPHDPAFPLIIDPVIVLDHSSFLGGGESDAGRSIAADGSGAAFVTGNTQSTDFPITPGAHDTTLGGSDAFVTKVNPAGNAVEFSTYLGGGNTDAGSGIAIGPSGAPSVAGETFSADFPTVPGAPDTSLGGSSDAFVSQLNTTGTALVSSTFLGGGDSDQAHDMAIDPAGAAYVSGETESSDFPTPGTPYDASHNSPGMEDVFVTKLNAGLTDIVYSTFLGGSAREFPGDSGIAVDASGAAYLTGQAASADFPTTPGAFNTTHDEGDEIFVTKLNPAGSALAYSTFLGGQDDGEGISVDASGSVYVTGEADPGFPTTPGAHDQTVGGSSDGYITKLNPAGSALVYSTVIGGSDSEDVVSSVVVDASGRASIAGQTSSADFPTTPGAHDATYAANTDAWVATVSAAGDALVASTFLGGGEFEGAEDIAVDPFGRLYVTGSTSSGDFPTASFDTTYGGNTDGFVSRLGLKCPGLESRPGLHIVGTAGDDVLVGSAGKDLICADDGNDVVKGEGGADTIIGDNGSDRLTGGAGKDLLKGGNQKDTLRGGKGRDTLKGGKGKDTLKGQAGADTLNGGRGKDNCSPGPKAGRERSCER